MRRTSTHLDHLALGIRATIDIGFIVVLFLMIAGKLREPTPFREINEIQLPSSVWPVTFDPDGEMATIYIGFGKVMLKLPDTIRKQTLVAMGNKYHLGFSNEETDKFKRIAIVGMPLDSLKIYIDGYGSDSHNYGLGIRIDSARNELGDWIRESEKACERITQTKLHFYIYCDQREEYHSVRRIFDILRQQGEYKWGLVTLTKSKE
jgi:hypothetical protein